MPRKEKGFTLIELLVVIAIIGLLAAIAIPVFLGQRERAKLTSIIASANTISAEIAAIMDNYKASEPVIFGDSGGDYMCYEHVASETSAKCSAHFPDVSDIRTYADLETLLDQFIIYHNVVLEETSPLASGDLLTRTPGTIGRINIVNTTDSSIYVTVLTMNGDEIFSKSVVSR